MTKTIGQKIVEEWHKQFAYTNYIEFSNKAPKFKNLAEMINEATKQEYKRGWEDCYDHYQWGIKLSDPTA